MASIAYMCTFFKHVLLQPLKTNAHHGVRLLFFTTLFLIGIAHLVGFFNAGDLSLVAYDWVKEDAYLNTLREAQINGIIPWRWSEPFYHGTQYFLANPEVILTPDIILLRWIPNNIFILIHVVLLYTIGFLGCLQIAKELNTSLTAFFIFWLIFNFNGYLIAHLAVGHLQWAGYFLLPLFFTILLRFMVKSQNAFFIDIVPTFCMGLLLGMLFLNGSFHIAVWCSIFMSIAILWKGSMLLSVVAAIIIGSLIGLGRLLPAVLWFPEKKYFVSGYPSFGTLIDAITSLRGHEFPHSGGIFGTLGWWEYDIYIGFAAFIIISISISAALKQCKMLLYIPIFAASGVMLLFSFGNVYALLPQLHIPFSDIERVSSRFVILPFIWLLIIATKGIDVILQHWPMHSKLAVLVGVPFASFELALHSFHWRVSHLEDSFQKIIKPIISLISNYDHRYTSVVYASWFVSLISFLLVIAVLFFNQKIKTNKHSTRHYGKQ